MVNAESASPTSGYMVRRGDSFMTGSRHTVLAGRFVRLPGNGQIGIKPCGNRQFFHTMRHRQDNEKIAAQPSGSEI
jgi:hypothetical protein